MAARPIAQQTGVLVEGRPSVVVDLPKDGEAKRIFLWRDVRVLLLSPNVNFSEFLKFLGPSFHPIKQYNWPAELLNDRAFVVESTDVDWRRASDKIDSAVKDGRLLGLGRIGFDRRDGGPHAKLVLSGFTALLAPSHTADELEAEANAIGLTVSVRHLGGLDVIVRPRASIDPLVLLTFAAKMVSQGILSQGSIEIDWAAPVQSR